jgi:hypothetical protein
MKPNSKLRRIKFRFEKPIVKEFTRYNVSFNFIDLKFFVNRGEFMQEEWTMYHLYFELLNFSINIDYEI